MSNQCFPGGDEVYDDFAATFGRRHATPEEYKHRRAVFHDNRKFIEDWNTEAQSSDTHMLALNHFADWTQVCMLPFAFLCLSYACAAFIA